LEKGEYSVNTVTVPSSTLISYSRDKKGNPRGVLVAVKVGNRGDFNIGYAQCRKEDKFNKNMGLKIALGRASFDTSYHSLDNIPHDLRKMLPSFISRCERYYKVTT
jgi:hypothetical protein